MFQRRELNFATFEEIYSYLSDKGRRKNAENYLSLSRTLALPGEIKKDIENAKDFDNLEKATADIKDVAIEGVSQELDSLLEKKTREIIDKETDLETLDDRISSITDIILKEEAIRKAVTLAEKAATESKEESIQDLANIPGRTKNRLLIRASRFEDLKEIVEAPTNASLNARGFSQEEYATAREEALKILESKELTVAAENVRKQLR